jgi:hypothetical protein
VWKTYTKEETEAIELAFNLKNKTVIVGSYVIDFEKNMQFHR